jgi:hypothetical protein
MVIVGESNNFLLICKYASLTLRNGVRLTCEGRSNYAAEKAPLQRLGEPWASWVPALHTDSELGTSMRSELPDTKHIIFLTINKALYLCWEQLKMLKCYVTVVGSTGSE